MTNRALSTKACITALTWYLFSITLTHVIVIEVVTLSIATCTVCCFRSSMFMHLCVGAEVTWQEEEEEPWSVCTTNILCLALLMAAQAKDIQTSRAWLYSWLH